MQNSKLERATGHNIFFRHGQNISKVLTESTTQFYLPQLSVSASSFMSQQSSSPSHPPLVHTLTVTARELVPETRPVRMTCNDNGAEQFEA